MIQLTGPQEFLGVVLSILFLGLSFKDSIKRWFDHLDPLSGLDGNPKGDK